MRRLSDIYRYGWEYIEALPDYQEPVPRDTRVHNTPSNRQMVRFVARGLWRAVTRKVLGEAIWYIAYRSVQVGEQLGLSGQGTPMLSHSERFRLIPSPAGRYYADPFVVEHEGRHYVLFEDFDQARDKGIISWTSFDERGAPNRAQAALERDYHLSYPFVFRWNGTWYMTPEAGDSRAIELFKAVEFPTRWAFERVLIRDVYAVDPTLLQHGGLWWLFTNVAVPGASVNVELCLFYSESPIGEWTAHPMNPIVSDVRRARPAGRVFSHKGMLIRPGQDSSRRYGYATVLNHVTTLTTARYKEVPVQRLESSWMRGSLGTHTFNTDSVYEVVDTCRRPSRKF